MSFKISGDRYGRQLSALGVNCLFLIKHNQTSPSRLIVYEVYFRGYDVFFILVD